MKKITIGELCQLKYGDSLPERIRIEGTVPVYGSNGVVGYHNAAITIGNTIIVGRKGSVGKVQFNSGACFPIDTTYFIDETNQPCNLKWLYYVLLSLNLSRFNKAAAVPGINRNDVYDILIPFPTLQAQNEIVWQLETADRARQQRKAANAVTEQFLQSSFLHLFGDPVKNEKGWDMKRLSEMAAITKDAVQSGDIGNDKNYVGLEHIEKDSGRLLHYQHTSDVDLKSTKFSFTTDHILYGKLRPYLNKVCLPDIAGVCSTDILPIKPFKNKCDRHFLAYLMKQPFFTEKATVMSNGANLPRISPKILESFELIAPPLSLQQHFASLVAGAERLHQKQQQSEKELEQLFGALLQKYFEEKKTDTYAITEQLNFAAEEAARYGK